LKVICALILALFAAHEVCFNYREKQISQSKNIARRVNTFLAIWF